MRKPTGFPKMIRVGEVEYHLLLVRKIRGAVGLFDNDAKAIYLGLDQSPEEFEATFFHEWLHAVEDAYKMELGHSRIGKLEYELQRLVRWLNGACTCRRTYFGNK